MKKINEKIEAIIDIINDVIKAPETNILRSWFDIKEDIITELDKYILKLKKEDFSVIGELTFLFSPTSELQEISIDSGWG